MERILTDLELDIKEIKYLLKMRTQEPDFTLIARRRIKEMQNHLAELLAGVEDENNTGLKEETKPEEIKEVSREVPAEQITTPEQDILIEPIIPAEQITLDIPEIPDEPDTIVHIVEEETVTVEFAGDVLLEPEDAPEAELFSFPKESVLGESLRPSADIIKSMSLNDTFRFSRELFDGDTDKMNKLLQQISEMDTFANVMALLKARIHVDEEDECFVDFVELLKKYFA